MSLFSSLSRSLSGSKAEPVSATDALPGSSTPMPVPAAHHVNGHPLVGPWPDGYEVAYFAMGCFWGAERIFWQLPGVWTTAAGYMGGFTENPTYEQTCTARTGHTEAVLVVYDPTLVSYEMLLKAFWENHDPTQVNGQGNDHGTQYRSAAYPTTPAQLTQTLTSKERYEAALAAAGFRAIATEIRSASEAGAFYYAEDYHQQYLSKNPRGYCNHGYCQVAYTPEQAPTKVELPKA